MSTLEFKNIVIKENGEPLICLNKYPFLLEPIYYNQGFSKDKNLYLRETLVEKLLKVQNSLKGKYKLKIWDAWRSKITQNNIYKNYKKKLAIQNPYWSNVKLLAEVEKFVSSAFNPSIIPPHSTGGAVDLTLTDKDGRELDMGTEFDHFGNRAYAFYYHKKGSDKKIEQNRQTLFDAMLNQGFRVEESEWWHFDFGNQLWAAYFKKTYALYGETSPSNQ